MGVTSETKELIGTISTVGAAAVAAIYTFLTYRLLKVTAAGVQIAQRALSSSHRPYVGISGVRLEIKNVLEALLFIKIQNFGTIPARDLTIGVQVLIANVPFAEETPKQVTTLFPGVSNHWFAIPLSGDQLRPFTTDLGDERVFERMDVEIRVEYRGLADVQFETASSHHKNSQDSNFLEDRSFAT
jgi:hypothetical protein